jgi:hypothetical protein
MRETLRVNTRHVFAGASWRKRAGADLELAMPAVSMPYSGEKLEYAPAPRQRNALLIKDD